MRWIALTGALLVCMPGLLPTTVASASDLSISIGIGTPPPQVVVPAYPPIVVQAPPQLIVVPGTPVYYAPSLPYNYFVYGGGYYTFYSGAWFYATAHAGPWAGIPVKRVPRPVLAVPVEYYSAPPGHWKKGGPPPWAGQGKGHKGKKSKKGKDD